MKWDRIALFVIDIIFSALQFGSDIADKRKEKKRAKQLTLNDLVSAKRDSELLRRSQAPTVVIPPPSELARERAKRR